MEILQSLLFRSHFLIVNYKGNEEEGGNNQIYSQILYLWSTTNRTERSEKNNIYFSNRIFHGQMQNGVALYNCRGFSNIDVLSHVLHNSASTTGMVSCSNCKFWNICMVLTTSACWTGSSSPSCSITPFALLQKTGSCCLHWHIICKKQHPCVPS